MAMKLILPFGQTLFLASLPFLLYSLIRCFETIFREKNPLIELSKTVLLGVYLNYFLFMVAMMILNGLIETVKRPKEAEIVHRGSGIIPQVMRKCLSFTLIYACFQLIGFSLGPLLQQKPFEDLSLTTINGLKEFPRILEEKERYDAFMMTDFPFLSLKNELFEVGKIMGSRPIERSAMTISKDSRTVFLVGKERGVLRILDISDNQNLKMLSTLDLSVQTGPEVSLLLSSNEKILYVSNGLLFNIIDISNLRSPLMLASLIDFDLVEGHVNKDFSFIHTSMALSWNEKFLYVAGCTLQIFVVDNPKNPRLISSTGLKKNLFAISVATSADRKTLYFANGTVEAYDISLHPNKPALLKTFEGASSINSIILGKDNKTLYAAGRVGENIILEKIAIEESAPFLKSVETFDLGIKSTSAPWILEKSSEESTFFFFTTQDVTINISNKTSKNPVFRVYNLAIREILNHPKNLFLTGPGTLRMIPNTKSFVVSKEDQLNIVTFFSNYPNPYSFGLSNSTLGMYKPPERIIVTAVPSTLGIDRLYAITIFRSIHYFSIIDMFNKDDPEILVSFPLDIQAGSIKVAESANRAFAIDQDDNKIQVLNFSDISKVESLGLVQLEPFDQKNFHLSNDGKTVFLEIPSETIAENQLRMLDFSDLSSVKVTAAEKIDTSIQDSTAQVSSSQGIIFLCLKKEVSIYNLSAPSSSRKIASFAAPSKGELTAVSIVQCHLFEEKGIFFLETNNWDATHYLSVFNISELTSPQLLTTIPLPQFRNREEFITARISSDAAKVYFWDLEHISVIDLSDIKSPVIIGQIPLSWSSEYSGVLPKFYLSGDDKFAYFEALEKIYIVNLQMKYTLFLRNNNFALGKKYAAVDFMLLRMMNGKSNFETFAQSNYKIIKLSLFKIFLGEERYEAQTRFIPLADWISYDKENSLLNIESKKEGDLGNHTLYSACSLKIPFDAFEFIGNRSAAEDLVASLVSVGFLDNQRFLTSSFGGFENFLIQSQYSDQKTQIYKTLKEYYFETFTPLELVPSLDLRDLEGSNLSIQTPSLDVIKVDIKLKSLDNESPQFLLRNYGAIVPLISEHKTHLRMEGSLSEVNFALAKLVINNKTLDCDGEIIVTDNLNQPLVKDVKNIAKYFTNNKPPRVNLDVQNQINIVPIYTGEFTSINLNQKTFVDDNVEDLSYKLVMNTPERHEKPSWIAFSNNDLTIKVTAPEQLFNREIKLLLIAENEFEKLEVPFVLKIRLSSAYILKLLIQSSPYLLTIIGLYIKANKIYNIVFVKWYKHKKEYFVEIEKEIEIPPIWFIAEEKKESELIFKKMMRDLGSDRDKLVDHFWNPELDVEKLRQTIEETVAGIGDKKKLKFYLSEGKSRKNLIRQMIENSLVLWKLDSKQEKITKEIYNKMKSYWSELVDWDNSRDQFVICQERFDEILTSFGGEEVSDLKDITGDSIYLSESLLKKNDKQINIDLLKKSLLILTFENHSLNLKGVKAYVKVKQREVGNCFMKVLREDLIDVSFSHKGTAGYGIMYSLDEDRLEFSGVPKKHLEDETLIIQITNIHERIVKELWIHGVGRRNEVMDKSYGVL